MPMLPNFTTHLHLSCFFETKGKQQIKEKKTLVRHVKKKTLNVSSSISLDRVLVSKLTYIQVIYYPNRQAKLNSWQRKQQLRTLKNCLLPTS